MADAPPSSTRPTADGTAPKPPLQFSLQSLLALMTIVALALPLAIVFGRALWAMLILGAVFLAPPVAFGSAAVYSRGRRRTFFGGAAAAGLFAIMFTSIARATSGGDLIAFAAGLWLVELACGWLALAVRNAVERRGWDRDE